MLAQNGSDRVLHSSRQLEVCEICDARMKTKEMGTHMRDHAEFHVKLLQQRVRAAEERVAVSELHAVATNDTHRMRWSFKTADIYRGGSNEPKSGEKFLSPKFTLRGVSGFQLAFFPMGTRTSPSSDSDARKNCAVFLIGPKGFWVQYDTSEVIYYSPADHSYVWVCKRDAPTHVCGLGVCGQEGSLGGVSWRGLVVRGWGDNDTQATGRPCRMSVIIVMRRSHAPNCRHEGGTFDYQWRQGSRGRGGMDVHTIRV